MQVPPTTSAQPAAQPAASRAASVFPAGQLALFAMVTGLFFLWGVSNNLTDILIQQFRKSFELSTVSAQLVSTANFMGYFCMAIPAALIMQRWGYKTGMVLGLCLFGSGMVLFWPAAVSGQYAPFLVALFAVGCGAATLETAANPFVAQLGPASTSERRLNFAQAFNPPGTVIGVWIGRQFIFSGVELTPAQIADAKAHGTYTSYLHSEIMRVVPTYIALGCVVLLFAFALSRMRFPSIQREHEAAHSPRAGFRNLFRYPQLWYAVAANALNVGAQICIWSNIIFYMKQYTVVPEKIAANYIIYSLLALLAGRFISTPLMKYIQPSRLLGLYGAAGALLVGFAVVHRGWSGVYAIVAASFFLSVIFPTIFALGLKGLGDDTKLGASVLVMAIVGGAVFPLLLGFVVRNTGSMALGFSVPCLCFAGVALYGFMAPAIAQRATP